MGIFKILIPKTLMQQKWVCTFLWIFLLQFLVGNLHAQGGKIPEGFSPLFNGKDLSGWHVSKTNHHGTIGNFSVEDGALVMKQYPYGQGGIILTEKKIRRL